MSFRVGIYKIALSASSSSTFSPYSNTQFQAKRNHQSKELNMFHSLSSSWASLAQSTTILLLYANVANCALTAAQAAAVLTTHKQNAASLATVANTIGPGSCTTYLLGMGPIEVGIPSFQSPSIPNKA